jgi:hypothetical protein
MLTASLALSGIIAIPVAALLYVEAGNGGDRWGKPVDADARKAAKRLERAMGGGGHRRAGRQGGRGGGSDSAAFTLKGDMANQVVGPMQVSGEYRVIESSKALRARNLLIRNIVATNLKRDGIRLRGDIDGAQVRDFNLQMSATPQVQGQLPIGIAVQSGRRITISDGVVRGFRMVEIPGNYTNGDGIATEREVHDLTIRGVVASDNSDGGFDLKSSETKLDQLRSERNKRNYRFWSTVEAGTLTSIDPRGAHIWAAKSARVHIKRLVASSSTSAPLVLAEGGASVIIDSCELRLPPGTPRIKRESAGAQVQLGRGCE